MMPAVEASLQLDMDAPLLPRAPGCPVPLAGPQRRWWRHLAMYPGQNVGALGSAVRIAGSLDTELLRRSVVAVVARHESLRTRIASIDGKLYQHVDPPGDWQPEFVDLSALEPSNVTREARRIAEEFAEQKVDLFRGPLFKAALLKLSSCDHVLVLAAEHIISDAASFKILHKEIWSLYRHATPEASRALQPPAVQFADYAVWQDRTNEAWRMRHESYWREHLAHAPRTVVPVDYATAEMRAPTTLYVPFGKRLSERLREFARREGCQLPLVVLTAYACAMARWCEQRDLLLALISHGRHCHAQLREMVGFLAACVLLRVEVAPDDGFLDVLKRVRLEFDSAFFHYDFDRALELVPECTTQLGFNWIAPHALAGSADECLASSGQLHLQPFPLRLSWTDNLLTFFSDGASGIVASITYRPDCIALSTVERFAADLRAFSSVHV